MEKNDVMGGSAGNNRGAKVSLHSIDSLFSDTWKLYKERFSVLAEIVLLPALVMVLGYILVGLGSPFSAIGSLVVFVGIILFAFILLPVIFSINNATGVDASYRAALPLFWPFIWLVILEILAVMGGFVMVIIPGIWLAVAFSLIAYVFVIEHRRGLDALRQSRDYIKGYWWAVLGRTLLLALLYVVVVFVVELPAKFIGGTIAVNIVSMALVVFFLPFSIIYHYSIFENLRGLKPNLAGVQTKEGTGFIKASAIVGIVAPVIIFIAAIILIGWGLFHVLGSSDRHIPPPSNNVQQPY